MENEEEEKPREVKEKQPRERPYPPPPFPQRLAKQKHEKGFEKFMDVFKKLTINIPFAEALKNMPSYAKFMKDVLSKKRRLGDHETVALTEECSAILQKKLPPKLKDPGTDFIVCDIEEDAEVPIILGRPFLATGRVLIDVTFSIFSSMKFSNEKCYAISLTSAILNDSTMNALIDDPLTAALTTLNEFDEEEILEYINLLDAGSSLRPFRQVIEPLNNSKDEVAKPSIEVPPELELKQLPHHLKYAYLGENSTLPVIVSTELTNVQEEKLLRVLKGHKRAIGWTLADIKGISPLFCQHKIILEEEFKPSVQPQRRLNPNMKEVVKKEIVKWLDVGIIYPISDSSWVSPVQCVPKKGGMTVVTNEKNELIPTRTITGWRICMDYRKLNKATKKDHFPLPFIDQMLNRLAGKVYYCFLDGYAGYNQIPIMVEDQENTTFTCPYGTFAFRRMPFGLCNAPATFQRCMMAIFSDMVENGLEVFMDDFSVHGDSFDMCLENLTKVLERCEETNLVLNWEKCHFMVQEGIVLGHKVSSKGLEVDRTKIETIEKLPPPTTVKGIRSFLGHAGFYRRFIKDFSKISKPLCNLLEKDVPFKFDENCMLAFQVLKEKLVSSPIIVALIGAAFRAYVRCWRLSLWVPF
ncbi:hypothetical protein K2173_009881 [Erythroxylum novogranatense]|uniref:Reverse transcriptase domain-containing protein n=1 Tax=Erythroxylum novogranatense TaxID=1862640 RepID=A0AAV8T0K5_9ROSI|nr:hypothetical protein K2173_009881 [Erythroxylum novogranatense]